MKAMANAKSFAAALLGLGQARAAEREDLLMAHEPDMVDRVFETRGGDLPPNLLLQ